MTDIDIIAQRHQDRLDAAIRVVQKFDPKFKVVYKSSSRLQRVLGKVLHLLGSDGYWMTIGSTTYRPDVPTNFWDWEIVLHEGRHAIDAKKVSAPLLNFAYMMPQILAAPALAWGLASGCWLGILAALALLAPLPALFRAWIEYRAYKVSLAVGIWSGDRDGTLEYGVNHVVEQFVSKSYYWMFPFRKQMRKALDTFVKQISSNTYPMDTYMIECKALARSFGEEDGRLGV